MISVKAGQNVNPGMVRDLGRVMAREGHRLGLFVSAVLPTKGMTDEAASHGLIDTEWGRFPALQTYHAGGAVQRPQTEPAPARQPQPPRAARGNPRQPQGGGAGEFGVVGDVCLNPSPQP